MDGTKSSTKLTLREHLGYGIASLADSIGYVFIGSFLLVFLTTVAGLAPATAGAIAAVGSVSSALFNPIIGFFSDRIATPLGRRRPLLLVFALPLAIVITLLFTAVPLNGTAKTIYYGGMLLLFWFIYLSSFIPYYALGVDYTSDYDDRTKLRLFAALFNGLGNMVCLFIPTAFTAAMIARGFSQAFAWTIVSALLGIASAVSLLITFTASKEKDPPCRVDRNAAKEPLRIRKLFSEYVEIVNLPPAKWLILASVTSLIAYTLITADVVYYLTYRLLLPPVAISFYLVLQTVFRTLLLYPQGKIASRFDKQRTIILFYLFAVAGFIVVRFIDPTSVPAIVFFEFLVGVTTGTYWAIIPSIYYDVCDYDQLHNGRQRQGTIISFQGVIEGISSGAGSLLLGCILQLAGFDGSAAVQSELAVSWIHNCATIVPAVFMVLSCLALWKYPITREVYARIQEELIQRQSSGQ